MKGEMPISDRELEIDSQRPRILSYFNASYCCLPRIRDLEMVILLNLCVIREKE